MVMVIKLDLAKIWSPTSDGMPFVKIAILSLVHDMKALLPGLLIIFNSSFIFEDVEISKNYESIFSSNDAQVHKFSKENKKINTNYKKCVFRKSITV